MGSKTTPGPQIFWTLVFPTPWKTFCRRRGFVDVADVSWGRILRPQHSMYVFQHDIGKLILQSPPPSPNGFFLMRDTLTVCQGLVFGGLPLLPLLRISFFARGWPNIFSGLRVFFLTGDLNLKHVFFQRGALLPFSFGAFPPKNEIFFFSVENLRHTTFCFCPRSFPFFP